MCTTNNSTKKRGALASLRRVTITHARPKKQERTRATKRGGRNCRIVESQRHKRHHSPRLDKNAAMCSKRLISSFPLSTKRNEHAGARLDDADAVRHSIKRSSDLATFGADRVNLQRLCDGESIVGLAQGAVDRHDPVAIGHVAKFAACSNGFRP